MQLWDVYDGDPISQEIAKTVVIMSFILCPLKMGSFGNFCFPGRFTGENRLKYQYLRQRERGSADPDDLPGGDGVRAWP